MTKTLPPDLQKIRLPRAPVTASKVPWLTSIHAVVNRGPWGRSDYHGNCGGYLIKDLVQYFGARRVLDPMTGSGTCRDVCRDLGVECESFDLKAGQNAGDPASYAGLEPVDFVWLRPPYWRMIRYSDDPRCLSNAPSLEAFLDALAAVLVHAGSVLRPRGHMAVLIGGYRDLVEKRYMPLPALTTARAIDEGFWPASTEIVRFQHGNTSSRRGYDRSFIPGLHDVCILLRRA